jgi:hypothetical protein
LHLCTFSDEINFEKFKKVVKKLIEGVGIWTPVTLTFYDKSELEVVHLLNHHNNTVLGSGGGVTELPSKSYQIVTNLNAFYYC